jgi:hypothetical protein
MRLFFTTKSDPSKLTMLPHQMARQHPGRREHIHGRIHEMACKCSACRKVAA